MRYYDELFSALSQPIAQVLLSADALDSKSGYQNAQATFAELLRRGVIPVVNENDSVAISELRFGDNDSLSALVATLVGASHLYLATDVDALYTSNPHAAPAPGEPPAEPIRELADISGALARAEEAAAAASGGGGGGSQWGTGGIVTKLRAAQLAAAAGTTTVILSSQRPDAIGAILEGARDVGTVILPSQHIVTSRKRWIMALPPRGSLKLDADTARSVREGHSLFHTGISAADCVVGDFSERDPVLLLDEDGHTLAHALTNCASNVIRATAGRPSRAAASLAPGAVGGGLGDDGPDALAHRSNIARIDLGSHAGELDQLFEDNMPLAP